MLLNFLHVDINELISCDLIIDLEHCIWSEWNTEDVNGYKTVCQRLDCKKNGRESEIASGKRSRRILKEPKFGGNPCSPDENGCGTTLIGKLQWDLPRYVIIHS